jgi:hypothetical protein
MRVWKRNRNSHDVFDLACFAAKTIARAVGSLGKVSSFVPRLFSPAAKIAVASALTSIGAPEGCAGAAGAGALNGSKKPHVAKHRQGRHSGSLPHANYFAGERVARQFKNFVSADCASAQNFSRRRDVNSLGRLGLGLGRLRNLRGRRAAASLYRVQARSLAAFRASACNCRITRAAPSRNWMRNCMVRIERSPGHNPR